MTRRILPVAAAMIWQAERLLLAQRPPAVANGSLWELPGGKIEFGERPEESLRRELREELGMDVVVGRIYGVFSRLEQVDLQVLLLVYACHPGDLPPRSLQCEDFCWVSPRRALDYRLAPLDREILERLAAEVSAGC